MTRRPLSLLALVLFAPLAHAGEALRVGTLHSDPARIAAVRAAGITIATVELGWDRYQPQPDRFDDACAQSVRGTIEQFRKAGQKVYLDLGLQYPPEWVRRLPDAKYVNQYGDGYDGGKPGTRVVNGVFSQAIRDLQAVYVAKVLKEIAPDVDAVRLGWNYFGELGFPAARFNGQNTCFWGFDDVARGISGQRPPGIKPCPTRAADLGHEPDAKRFIEWYLDALVDYQSWQIRTVRRLTKAKLVLLYGSWGIRPGTIDRQLLDGRQTELSLGYDFGRLINAIRDDDVAVCTTWLDADPRFGDDEAADPARWSPVHFVVDRCAKRRTPLEVWGENTGDADLARAELSVTRARRYRLSALVWAFEPQLFDPAGQFATLGQLEQLLKR